MSRATDKQSDQGRQYGQPGFVGEPINLNVVNADIRDILNYITEQYGVNFVIDASVTAVPVTVNVQDVPWNVALDAVLKANRLGIEVNGNILRVATTDVLAKEAETQKVINDSRLDASPLVTEFIRLAGPGSRIDRGFLRWFNNPQLQWRRRRRCDRWWRRSRFDADHLAQTLATWIDRSRWPQ
jgi:hypothetical protein